MKKNLTKSVVAATVLALGVSGCADMSATQRGTATGAGAGAALGALIGGTTSGGGSNRAAKGAVIGGAAGAVIGNIWSKRMEQQKQAMEQATRGTGVQVSQTSDNRLKLEIPSDVSFDTGRSDIKSNFQPVLDRFATTLQENPATTVTIIGHTDSTGTPDINQPLCGRPRRASPGFPRGPGLDPGPHHDRGPGRARADRLEQRCGPPCAQPPRGDLRG